MSLINEFFEGKSVFITGATGFVGKVLVEKLLRCCTGIERVYILIRAKQGQSVEERWKNYCKLKIFNLNINMEKFQHKLVPIAGDLSLPNVGLKESDLKLLCENVQIIYHVAGDVKFNEPIREAVTHNLIGTHSLLKLCAKMHKLEALAHVSTAYAFCQFNVLEEKIYPMKATPEEVINAVNTMSDHELKLYTNELLEGRPNHYTFAKALAEHVVLNERKNLPVAIIRPSIVISSYKEPIEGWCDNFNGATGISILGSLGIMRIADCDTHTKLSFIPVDMCCDAIIAASFYVAKHKPRDIQIYHVSSEPNNTPQLLEIISKVKSSQHDSPSIKVVRPHAGVPKERPSKIRVWLTIYISHILFAYFVDSLIWLMGYKPVMVSITNRMHTGFEMLRYFWMSQWTFKSDNTRKLAEFLKKCSPIDSDIYKFDVSEINWDLMMKNSWIGGRKFLLKESDDNIPLAKKRLKKIIIGYRIFLCFWYSLVVFMAYWLVYALVRLVFY